MEFKKLFLLCALASFALQTVAMEHQSKSPSSWQQVTQYKYPALIGLGVFVSGAANSCLKGALAQNLATLATAALATTATAMSVQSLCPTLFSQTEEVAHKDSITSAAQENRGSVVVNEDADETKADISNPDLQPDIIDLIKLHVSEKITAVRTKEISQKFAGYSKEQIKQLKENFTALNTELRQPVKNARKICSALNKMGAIISPYKAVAWNTMYETGYKQLREWLAEDMQRIKHNKPVIHEEYINSLCIMQDHPQLKYIKLFYDQVKSDQRPTEQAMQWLFDHATQGLNVYFGWDRLNFEWPKSKRFWLF